MRFTPIPLAIAAILTLSACGSTAPASGGSSASSAAATPVASTPPATSTPSSALPSEVPGTAAVPATPTVAPTPTATVAGHLSLVVLGDSIPYGREDCGGCDSFPTLFAQWITASTGSTVDLSNLSRHDGYTASRMAVDLPTTGSSPRELVAGADIVVVTIGHNDTPWNATDDACDADQGPVDGYPGATWSVYQGSCVATEVDRFRSNLDKILLTIVDLRAGKPTAFRLTTQYNDVLADPGVPNAALPLTVAVKDAFNQVACDVAAAHGFECVDVYHAFNGPNGDMSAGDLESSADYTHPSAKGHMVIAQLLEQAGLAPLDIPVASPDQPSAT